MRRVLVGVVGAWFVVGAWPGVAAGHAAYQDSSPANKARVSSPPSEVWAEFTEPVTQDSHLEIYDPCGDRVDAGNSSVSGYRITVTNNGVTSGTYTVRFDVISALDGHPTNGSFTFTSTGGEACPGAEEPEPEEKEERREKSSEPSKPSGQQSGTGDQTDDSAAPGDPASKDKKGKHQHHRGDKKKNDPVDTKGLRGNRGIAAGPRAQSPPAEKDGGDMPLDGLLIALGIAALIGGAGGLIYAGIMGPRV